MIRLALAFCWLAFAAGAQMLEQNVPVTVIAVGGHCMTTPDEVLEAPNATAGVIEHSFRGFDYILPGDQIDGYRGLGIGLRARLGNVRPGETVVAWIDYPDGSSAHWQANVDDAREIEFGSVPDWGQHLPPGLYLLSVRRGSAVLFEYAITVTSSQDDPLCEELTS